jgi:hypothetical protein
MAGRERRARLWVALPGGAAINGALLLGLILFEPSPPILEEPPLVTLSLERQPERRRTAPAPTFRTADETAISPAALSEAAPATRGPTPSSQASPPPAGIDPAWTVDGGAWVDPARRAQALARWKLVEGGPGTIHRGRFGRACAGLSNEHMTDEEKDRCYGGWNDAYERQIGKKIGPREAPYRDPGPLALKDPGEQGPFAKQARKQERCRDYRKRTMPGMKGVEPPPLREGGCF